MFKEVLFRFGIHYRRSEAADTIQMLARRRIDPERW